MKKIVSLLLMICFCAGLGAAATERPKKVYKPKAKITRPAKKKVAIKKPFKPAPRKYTASPSEESGVTLEVEEKTLGSEESESVIREKWRAARFRREVGGRFGIFAGTTAFLGEVRIPLKNIVGPTTTALRLTAGLAQNSNSDVRYYPAGVDLIFNFPPGLITGTQNYLGVGLNYSYISTDNKLGSFGGQLSYGVESEGFGGIVFGELGYGILRSGYLASQKGLSVLVGIRLPIGGRQNSP